MIDSDEAWYDGEPFMGIIDYCDAAFGETVAVKEFRLFRPQPLIEESKISSFSVCAIAAAVIWYNTNSYISAAAAFVVTGLFIFLASVSFFLFDITRLEGHLKKYLLDDQVVRLSGKDFHTLLDDPAPGQLHVFKWSEVHAFMSSDRVFTIGGQQSVVFFRFTSEHDRVMFALSR